MEYNDVKRFGLILAVQAEIEGMKTSNEQYLFARECPKYSEQDFKNKAEELRKLSYVHDEQL